MSQAWATIIAALVTATGSVLVVLFSKMRKENKEDHGRVVNTLTVLHDDIKDVAKKLDGHIDWHLKDKK
jgi:hypothetical protein